MELVEDAPQAWGVAADARGLLLATNTLAEPDALVLSGDRGVTWSGMVSTDSITGPLDCQEGSASAEVCDRLWSDLKVFLSEMRPSGPSDPAPPGDAADTDASSSCASSVGQGPLAVSPGAWIAAGLLVVGLLRRR